MVEILMKKLEAQMFKAMHHYMGLSVDDYSQSFEGNLEALVDLVKEKQTRVMNITLANLIITLDVHNENAMKNLLVKGVKINEFDWIMNMPYYWGQSLKPDEYNCIVKSVQTDFPYSYEYVDNDEICSGGGGHGYPKYLRHMSKSKYIMKKEKIILCYAFLVQILSICQIEDKCQKKELIE